MIKVENLSFRYNKDTKLILDNISLTVEKSSVVSIIGLNGSGKTTLIKLLTGILKPDKGNIYVDNKDLNNLSFNERSRLLSYVPQLVRADYDFTVIDYLSFSLTNRMNINKSPNKEDLEKIAETSKLFNIEHLLDKKINKLSGGEKQIVSICSAFILVILPQVDRIGLIQLYQAFFALYRAVSPFVQNYRTWKDTWFQSILPFV